MATIRPRRAGVLIPTFAIRTGEDLGIGDTGGVRELVDWAADTGLGFVQFLPINATGSDSSPYNAISSVALDYLTLDLSPDAVPELDAEFFRETTAKFGVGQLRAGAVQYERVRELKGALLRRAFGRLRAITKRGREFAKFRAEESEWLEDFCLFRVLMEENGHEDWTSWPDPLNTAAKAREWLAAKRAKNAKAIDSRLRFHAYVQWLCFSQWRAVR
ncbi:MAG: 4-alpha-glucanotransferase, partial [Chthoniobacteraceae bacterium]